MIFLHYTRNGQKRVADMFDTFYGQTALLLGGAPSLKEQTVERLAERGVITMAMNNAALHFQPMMWVSGDRPECYEPRILLDPKIMKFGNAAHARTKLDAKYNDKHYREMPNMYFYLPEDNVSWDEYLASRRGVPWYSNTLFVGIHILYQLGIRRIILGGSDFGFAKSDTPDQEQHGGDMYAHETSFGDLERKWNLDLYNSLVRELRRLKPVFDRAKLEFFDCSKNSRVAQVYKHLTLEEAVNMCLEKFPAKALSSTELPHCSKFAPESIQQRIAKWPGHQVVGAPIPAQAEQRKTPAKTVL